MKNLEYLLGYVGKSMDDFDIIYNFPIEISNNQYNICVVFVDNVYQALLFNYERIVIKDIEYARNKYNLLKILYDKYEIQDIQDILINKINEDE